MRITQDSNVCVAIFVKDSDEGTIVETPDGDMNINDMGAIGEPFYLKSGEEIFYPGWAEW